MYDLALSSSTFSARINMSSAVKIPVDSMVTKLKKYLQIKWSLILPKETPSIFMH